jgi:2'-5' RNA ligase
MGEKIRSFIAIELNKEIQDALANIQTDLRSSGADIKWVKPRNIHLTLKFLGNIDTNLIPKIKNILEDITKKYKNFSGDLTELGAFPKLHNPRVIWVGMQTGKDKIISITKELEDNLSKIGIPQEEKEFHPHVTLGRIKSSINRLKLVELLNNTKISILKFQVKKITLFKSTLTPEGPIYEAKLEVNLKEH